MDVDDYFTIQRLLFTYPQLLDRGEIDADSPGFACSTSCVMVFQQTADLPPQSIIGGDYADRFQKVDGQWRFIERRIRNDQLGDLSAHGRYRFGAAAPDRSGA